MYLCYICDCDTDGSPALAQKGQLRTTHHLIPQSLHPTLIESGIWSRQDCLNATIDLCAICHAGAHSYFTNVEMARFLVTPDRLKDAMLAVNWLTNRKMIGTVPSTAKTIDYDTDTVRLFKIQHFSNQLEPFSAGPSVHASPSKKSKATQVAQSGLLSKIQDLIEAECMRRATAISEGIEEEVESEVESALEPLTKQLAKQKETVKKLEKQVEIFEATAKLSAERMEKLEKQLAELQEQARTSRSQDEARTEQMQHLNKRMSAQEGRLVKAENALWMQASLDKMRSQLASTHLTKPDVAIPMQPFFTFGAPKENETHSATRQPAKAFFNFGQKEDLFSFGAPMKDEIDSAPRQPAKEIFTFGQKEEQLPSPPLSKFQLGVQPSSAPSPSASSPLGAMKPPNGIEPRRAIARIPCKLPTGTSKQNIPTLVAVPGFKSGPCDGKTLFSNFAAAQAKHVETIKNDDQTLGNGKRKEEASGSDSDDGDESFISNASSKRSKLT